MTTPEEFAAMEAATVAAVAGIDQIAATYRPMLSAMAAFEKGAVDAGLSYSAAAKLTIELAKTTGFPWGFSQ